MEAFKAVETAKQGKETSINNANKYRNEKLPIAEADADQILQEAEATKQERINEANAQVAMFNAKFEEYEKNPEVTKKRMFYEAMEGILPQLRVIIDGTDSTTTMLHEQLNSIERTEQRRAVHLQQTAAQQVSKKERKRYMKKTTKRIVIGVAAFVAVICGLSALVVTKENEYTLIMRFGKINSIKTEAGLSFKVPFLDSEQTLPKEILLYDMAASDVITKDKKTMIADSYVLWQISDPILFSKTLNRSVSNAEGRIDAAVFNATKNAISTLTQNEVIAARDGELKELIRSKVGNSMDSYGVRILMAEIKQLDLPEDNKAAVYERMISERNQIAASYQAEGDSEAKKIRNSTDKEISIMLSDAKAEAANTIAEGESEYMRILGDAYNTPERAEFYEFDRALEAAKTAMSGSDKTLILPKDSPLASIFMGEEN